MWTLGSCYRRLGQYQEAEKLYHEILESRRAVFGEESPATMHALANLGLLRRHEGRLAEAEEFMRRAADGFERILPKDDPRGLVHRRLLAEIVRDQRRYDEADRLFEEVINTLRDEFGEQHPELLRAIQGHAELAIIKGDLVRAEEQLRIVVDCRRRIFGDLHPATSEALLLLLNLRNATGENEKSVELLSELVALEPQNAIQRNELAWLLLTWLPEKFQDPERALELARQANEDVEYRNAHYLDTLAAALYRTGAIREAIDIQHQALEYAPALQRREFESRLAEYESALPAE